MIVSTLEGDMSGSAGDFLVIGIENEQYIVRQDIFNKTYNLV